MKSKISGSRCASPVNDATILSIRSGGGLAERWFDKDDPVARAVLGTFLVVDPKGDATLGRQLIRVAGTSGIDIEELLTELDEFKR